MKRISLYIVCFMLTNTLLAMDQSNPASDPEPSTPPPTPKTPKSVPSTPREFAQLMLARQRSSSGKIVVFDDADHPILPAKKDTPAPAVQPSDDQSKK